jgi:hypothetical protein
LELQLWDARSKPRKEGPQDAARNIIHVSGNHNVVQAGTVWSAALIIDGDARDALLLGLETLRATLPEAHELSERQKTELREVVEDCEREIKDASPNRSRGRSLVQSRVRHAHHGFF